MNPSGTCRHRENSNENVVEESDGVVAETNVETRSPTAHGYRWARPQRGQHGISGAVAAVVPAAAIADEISVNCQTCHSPIPFARLHALPHTTTCVDCSTEERVMGITIWPHKTGSYVDVVTPKQHAVLKRHDRRTVHSNMSMATRTVTGVQSSLSRPLQRVSLTGDALDTQPRARKCSHKEAPQASAYGMCLDCALEWYASRR